MPRATDDSVFGILDPQDFDTDIFNENNVPDFTNFIRPASLLVEGVIVANDTPSTTNTPYNANTLKEIETWLAAHFYRIPFPQLVREEVSTLREVFQQEVKVGLDQTRYGQMAKILDHKGYLAALDNTQKKITTSLPGSGKKAGAHKVGGCI